MGRLTDQAGNLDTSGTRGGPHTNIKGVAPVFDIADEQAGYKEQRDISLGERFKEKAVAGNDDQSESWPEHDRASHQQARVTDQTEDTTGTDTQSASGKDHETVHAHQTDTWDTTGNGQPSAEIDGLSTLEDGTSLKGEGSFTTEASLTGTIDTTLPDGPAQPITADSEGDEAKDSDGGTDEGGNVEGGSDEDGNEETGEEREAKVAAFTEVPMNDLYRLAKEQDPPVEIPAGADKPTLIDTLIDAGVEPPAKG